MIPFNKPCFVGTEFQYIKEAIESEKLCGDGSFTRRSSVLLERIIASKKVLLTTSCSHALDMSALLLEIKPGDEVIMPSFTFVSTANAFALRGAKVVFIDIRPDTMNMNEKLIESAITKKTRAIVPVHYAGVACEMDTINAIADEHDLKVIEDAAQGLHSYYKDQPLGTLGDLGSFSFHETKNYVCGEGGALSVNDPAYIEKAEIIREKGTNRSRFFRGQVDKYTWVDLGSSYLMSELNAAYLFGQLERYDEINTNRLQTWDFYNENMKDLSEKGFIDIPIIPDYCIHNAHMYYIKARDLTERTKLINFLRERDIIAVFHYLPLHSSPAGRKYGEFMGEDSWTTMESERLLRLPLFYGMNSDQREAVVDSINDFYKK